MDTSLSVQSRPLDQAEIPLRLRKPVEIADQDANLGSRRPARDTDNPLSHPEPRFVSWERPETRRITVSDDFSPDETWEQWKRRSSETTDRRSPDFAGATSSQILLSPAEAGLDELLGELGMNEPNNGHHLGAARSMRRTGRRIITAAGVWVDPLGWRLDSSGAMGVVRALSLTGDLGRTRGAAGVVGPGPEQQVMAPCVVSFSSYNGDIAWAPLEPGKGLALSGRASQSRFRTAIGRFRSAFGGCEKLLFPVTNISARAHAWEYQLHQPRTPNVFEL